MLKQHNERERESETMQKEVNLFCSNLPISRLFCESVSSLAPALLSSVGSIILIHDVSTENGIITTQPSISLYAYTFLYNCHVGVLFYYG